MKHIYQQSCHVFPTKKTWKFIVSVRCFFFVDKKKYNVLWYEVWELLSRCQGVLHLLLLTFFWHVHWMTCSLNGLDGGLQEE